MISYILAENLKHKGTFLKKLLVIMPNYRAVFPLNINLKKLWVSKIITALIYMSITVMVHMLGVYIFQFLIGEQLTPNYGFSTLLFASFLLIITNIWQIPLCFFLAKKFGFIASIAVNAVLGLGSGILLSDGAFWIYCTYSLYFIDISIYITYNNKCKMVFKTRGKIMINIIKSEIYKIKATWLPWIHIVLPIAYSLLFYVASKTTGLKNFEENDIIQTYFVLLGAVMPIILSFISSKVVDMEMSAGKFQVLLSTTKSRTKAYLGKLIVLELGFIVSISLAIIIILDSFLGINHIK